MYPEFEVTNVLADSLVLKVVICHQLSPSFKRSPKAYRRSPYTQHHYSCYPLLSILC